MRPEAAISVLADTPTLKDRWQVPPAKLVLDGTDVHLWRGLLDLTFTQYAKAISSLTAEDLARAAEYRFERERLRCIATRATLRGILCRYVGGTPRGVQLSHDEGSKPTLIEGSDHKIHFNVSHAGRLMICAVARSEVGVDIERCPSNIQREEILRLMFPSVAITEESEKGRDSEFVKLWTRTEAILKLDGCGLARIGMHPCAMSPAETGLTYEYFEPEQAYLGAVAWRGGEMNLQYWLWSFASTE